MALFLSSTTTMSSINTQQFSIVLVTGIHFPFNPPFERCLNINRPSPGVSSVYLLVVCNNQAFAFQELFWMKKFMAKQLPSRVLRAWIETPSGLLWLKTYFEIMKVMKPVIVNLFTICLPAWMFFARRSSRLLMMKYFMENWVIEKHQWRMVCCFG